MKSIVIMGVARSGTSALAGSFKNNDYFMGEDYLGVNPQNPKGGFECKSVVEVNSGIIR